MNSHTALLRCPMTGAPMRIEGHRLVAEGGGPAYAVEDGIYDLRCHRKDYYFNPVSRPAMAELTQRAAQVPWWCTVRTFLQHVRHNPDWLDNLASDSRYAWKLLLDLKPDAKVLDLGCGLGNLTRSLAPHVDCVYAMDLTIERLRFAKQRFAHFNREDRILLVAGGDGARLPFADHSLDLVTLSGVLEWVAADGDAGPRGESKARKVLRMALSFFGERNPRSVQTRFLREIRRVLKPDGQLFVAIENGHNQEYLHSRVDHHSGLRYASLLPRFAANLYSIAVRHRPYRTYTYSLPGYRRLMRAGGFPEQRFFGLLPGYSHLAEVTPLVNAHRYWETAKPAPTLKERIARHRHFVPAYGIVAGSALSADSLLGRVLSEVEARIGASGLKATALRVNADGMGLLRAHAGSRAVVVKFPFNSPSLTGLQQQTNVVLGLCASRTDLSSLLPRCLAQGRLQGVDYFVETRLPGNALACRPGESGDAHWLDAIAALLRRLHANGLTPTALDAASLDAEVDAPLRQLAPFLDDPNATSALKELLFSRLDGIRAGRGLVHGEFEAANILVDGGAISGLLGWEHARVVGLPIVDVIHYLVCLQRMREPHMALAEVIMMLADKRWPVQQEWDLLTSMYDSFATDAAAHREFTYLYWLQYVASRLDGGLGYDEKRFEQSVLDVLGRLR